MLDSKDRVLCGDLEAIGLLDDIQEDDLRSGHIIVAEDDESGEVFCFYDDFDERVDPVWLDDFEGEQDGSFEEGIKFLNDCKVLIMHNSAGFDYHAFEKMVGRFGVWTRDYFKVSPNDIRDKYPYTTMDTAVMSRTLDPERKLPPEAYQLGKGNIGPHTIESHGIRMGRWKPDNEDWTRLTVDMIHRCKEDVAIGLDYYHYLMLEWKEHLRRPNTVTGLSIFHAYYSELRVAFTIAYQSLRGFAVDVPFIASICEELDKEITSTLDGFRPHMPQRVKRKIYKEDDVAKKLPELTKLIVDVQGCSVEEAVKQANQFENDMWDTGFKGSYATTYYSLLTQKGVYVANVKKYIPEAIGKPQDHGDDLPVHGAFTPYILEDIPLGNREAVKQVLLAEGWLGINFNDTERDYFEEFGEIQHPWSGKIDEESLDAWKERAGEIPEWCEGIARWYILTSRRTQLLNAKDVRYFDANGVFPNNKGKRECRGILPKARLYTSDSRYGGTTAEEYYVEHGCWPLQGEWRVPANAFSCATNTFRMRHKVVVNIPSRGLYGKQMRQCFIAGKGKLLLGCDGSGLELRMLAHFMNDEEYIQIVLSGDIHTYNQIKAGLAKRDFAKTFIYAFLYGSGIPNLSRTLGIPIDEMGKCVARFKRELPQLASLLEGVEKAGAKFGYMLAVDGRRGKIRRKAGTLALHTALNVLLQMTGSLVMKYGHMYAEDECLSQGLIDSLGDFPIVCHMHDEAQMEVEESEVEWMEYEIFKDDWSTEEKRQHRDEAGRMWSAPKIFLESEEGTLLIKRGYHPLGQIYAEGIVKAGEKFGLRIKTDGEYLIGASWADTH